MKRKIFSVLFALVLVLSFSLVTAAPASAAPMRNILFITNGGTLNTENFDDDIKSAIEAQPGVTNIVTAAWPLPEHATDYDLVLLNDNTMLSDNPDSPVYSYHQRLVTYLQTDNKTLLLTGSAVYWADNLKMSTFATSLTSNADDKIFKVENNHADILPGSFKNVGDVIDLYEQRACKYSFMSQEAGGYEFRGIVLAATSIAVDLTGYGYANGKLATVGYMDPAEEHTFYEEIIAGTGTTPGAKIMVIGGRYDKGSGAPGRPDHLALFDDDDGKTLLWNALDWLSPPVLPNEVWVADTGNDSNPGTEAEPFATIQKGIDEVAAGDTINVAAGTYTEEITIDKANLTLQSESELGAIIRPSTTPTNHGAAIYISADGVTVDGFEVDGTTVCNNGIYGWETSGLTIKNNKVHGAVNAWDGAGISLLSWDNSGTVYDNLIEGNEVYDTGRMGISVMEGGTNYTVTSNNTITGNTVYDVWKKATAWNDGGGGIQINVAKDCSITNNVIYNVQDGQRGIYMYGSATGNTITGNTIRDNPIGIQLWISGEGGSPSIDWGSDTPTSPQVHYNDIYNNSEYGAKSSNIQGTPMVMDATNNWWGSANGPEHAGNTYNVGSQGNKVSDGVDYVPWYDAPYATGTSFAPVTSGGGGEFFSSIQAALDAASDDDIISTESDNYTVARETAISGGTVTIDVGTDNSTL